MRFCAKLVNYIEQNNATVEAFKERCGNFVYNELMMLYHKHKRVQPMYSTFEIEYEIDVTHDEKESLILFSNFAAGRVR